MNYFKEIKYEYPNEAEQERVIQQIRKGNPDVSLEEAKDQYKKACEACQYFANDTFVVSVRPYVADLLMDNTDSMESMEVAEMAVLSIRRCDTKPNVTWDEKQMIKDMIMGSDAECVELFPAAPRNFFTSNQYNLWVLPPGQRWPFGFDESSGLDVCPTTTEILARIRKEAIKPMEVKQGTPGCLSKPEHTPAMEDAFKQAQTDMQKAKDDVTEDQKAVFEQGKKDYEINCHLCPHADGAKKNLWILGQRAAAIELVTQLQEDEERWKGEQKDDD